MTVDDPPDEVRVPPRPRPAGRSAPRLSGRRGVTLALTVVALALGAGALTYLTVYVVGVSPAKTREQAAGPPPASPAAPTDPNVVTLDEEQLQRIKVAPVRTIAFQLEKNAVGRIAFNEDVTTPIFSPYTGRIVRLLARAGDDVRKGAPLFEIDTPDLVQAEADLIAAYGGVRKAQNQLELARRTAARQDDLFQAKAVAQKDWEQAQSDLRNAESDLRSAEGIHAGARDRLRTFGKTDAEILQIEERREIDRITRVLSPLTGTVASRKVGPGQLVKPDNPDPLFTIADLSTMWLLANVNEADIALIQLGQPVEVQVMAYPSDIFRARITNIGAAVDPATHRVAVRAEVANPGRKLKPEMFASFRITTSTAVPGLGVPVAAVVRDGETATVWVATGPKRFTRRPVKLGIEQQGLIQVLSGLQAGDSIVADGALLLSNRG